MIGRIAIVSCMFVATARADQIAPQVCGDVHEVFPRTGDTNVPLNAKVWIAGGTPGEYRLRGPDTDRVLEPKVHEPLRVFEIPLGALRAETTYDVVRNNVAITSFTTGTRYDAESPAPPRVHAVDAAHTSLGEIMGGHIFMHAHPSKDTVATWIVASLANDSTTLASLFAPRLGLLTQNDWCAIPALARHDGVKCFEVRAIDIAGNHSEPTTRCTYDNSVVAPRKLAGTTSRSSDDTRGAAVGLAIMGLVALAFLFARANAARRSFWSGRRQDVVDVEVLRRVARAQRTRGMLWLAGCFAATLGLVTFDTDTTTLAIVLPLPMVFLIICLARMAKLHQLATLRADDFTRVVSDGSFLFAARGKTLLGWVAASPSALARASALPVAKLRT